MASHPNQPSNTDELDANTQRSSAPIVQFDNPPGSAVRDVAYPMVATPISEVRHPNREPFIYLLILCSGIVGGGLMVGALHPAPQPMPTPIIIQPPPPPPPEDSRCLFLCF